MNKNKQKLVRLVSSLLFLLGIGLAFWAYGLVFAPNTNSHGNKVSVIIPEHATFNDVVSILRGQQLLKNEKSFIWLAKKKKYQHNIKDGMYLITDGMSNNELINTLRSGNQCPTQLTFNNIRTKEDLAGRLSKDLAFDSTSMLAVLNDQTLLKQYHLNPQTVIGIFIPNTYQVYWNISPEKLLAKMYANYQAFWNEERRTLSNKIKLKPMEVITLASIVEEESNLSSEKPIIAGLYINRLHRGMLLQADPTLRFALYDFTIRRIVSKYKSIPSPYNTYLYKGLPPGPIRIPSIEGIDAVLHYQRHEYLFMCAAPDLSGKHRFEKNYAAHLQNASAYQKALNKEKIFK